MLDTLSYNVTFPTGQRFDRTISFGDGMTAIIGPNEHGKSLTLEMIRFCLFGSAALRGDADDYKHLQASLTWSINGTRYGATRSMKNASFGVDGQEVTVRGTKPVNAAILALLGFDLDVFDVACAANQGDVERLASMKPTARREMVDRLIGADRIEGIVDWTAEQALGLKREIDVLQRGLVVPVAPEKPEGYRPIQDLMTDIELAEKARDQVVQIQAWLKNEPPIVTVPAEPPHAILRVDLDAAEKLFDYVPYDFSIEQMEQDWADYDAWQGMMRFMRAHPLPTSGVTVDVAEAEIDLIRLNRALAGLRKSSKICCPSCQHEFTLADREIADVEGQIEQAEQKRGAIPITGVTDWQQQLGYALDWATEETRTAWEVVRVKDGGPVAEPAISKAEIAEAKRKGIHIGEFRAALADLGLTDTTLPVIRSLRRQLDQYEADVAAAAPAQAKRTAWEKLEPDMRAALNLAEAASAGLTERRELAVQVRAFDMRVAAYDTQLAAYQALEIEIAEKQAERQSWMLGKDQLNALRLKLKGYLAPSLSTAASILLKQMTNGARREIWVSDAFEITVDGQKLQTLSGSGKVCANLALRLGLAQVLTNNVLSLFIGDEMDAYMDQERVQALNASLERLTGRVKQIIVITHKPPVCKQVIDLNGR